MRTSAELRGGITGAMRIAHLADAFRLRAEVHGIGRLTHQHLCMAIPNTTYYESLVTSTDVSREAVVDASGLVHAPAGVGLGLPAGPDYPPELAPPGHRCRDAPRRSCNTREERHEGLRTFCAAVVPVASHEVDDPDVAGRDRAGRRPCGLRGQQ